MAPARVRPQVLSHPARGKHTVFDGRLLHGAPAALKLRTTTAAAIASSAVGEQLERLLGQPSCWDSPWEGGPGDGGEVSAARPRVTFLVNIWLGHTPLGIEPLPPDAAAAARVASGGAAAMPPALSERAVVEFRGGDSKGPGGPSGRLGLTIP